MDDNNYSSNQNNGSAPIGGERAESTSSDTSDSASRIAETLANWGLYGFSADSGVEKNSSADNGGAPTENGDIPFGEKIGEKTGTDIGTLGKPTDADKPVPEQVNTVINEGSNENGTPSQEETASGSPFPSAYAKTDNADSAYYSRYGQEQTASSAYPYSSNSTGGAPPFNPSAASPYPGTGNNRSSGKRGKKPPTRKTLVIFGIITLVLCLAVSAGTGAFSSYLTVRLIEAHDKYANTTAPYKDELISVPTEKDGTDDGIEPSAGAVTEAQTEKTERVTSSGGGQKTKGEVYAESVNAIVGIKAEGTKEVSTFFGRTAQASFTSTGSGFFISDDGYIVTNYHVIENATKVTVTTYAGQAYEATITGYEASNDIAVLKAEGSFESVKIGDSSTLAVGDDILVIGNALGELSYTFTDGVVSYLNRAITTDSGTVINMYQTNAATEGT